ncbi:ferredoxin family 2Fe-2S iron-sulfur cluster binding protein [Iodidimonas sp. SYSU 1G8]|uniref:ferredoxin family 2Fe-2S iron-sulfur cluster binding protein n=1 Tax=Iodidimonas sp. SYSU 1G8 TaxID=3133967 RepID=UPI0031FEFA37
MPRMIFVSADGQTRKEVTAKAGESVLEIAHDNDIDIEGVCEGSMACSTCHVIVDKTFYAKLPKPSQDEEDMLDLAFGLRPTSRLGCQLVLTDEVDGLVVRLPGATVNMMDV